MMDDGALSMAFRALGHPDRLRIVRALLERALACCTSARVQDCTLDPASCNVGALAQVVDCAPSTLSRHLKELDAAGLIERAREGRFLYCRIHEGRLDDLRAALTRGGAPAASAAPTPCSRNSTGARSGARPHTRTGGARSTR